jgi:serine/threonine-protein kinase RsbW
MRRYPQQIWLKFKDPCYISVVRRNTELIAQQMGFDEDRIFELIMAVDEAYTNAIEHAGAAKDMTLAVEFLRYADRLEISISDSGCGFDLKKIKIPRSLKHINGLRGRGLSLIKKLSDKCTLNSIPGNGTLIKIVKFISARRRQKNACSPIT